MRGDKGHLQVLEAMLVTLVILGAAYAVITLKTPSSQTDRSRDRLEKIATDALIVLAGLSEANGNYLDLGFTESIHCVADANAPAGSCLGNKSKNLSFRLESYLPEGTGYALILDNGVGERELYRSAIPEGETVTASYSFLPDWNLTYVTTELSCYEAGMDVNATMLSIRHGSIAKLTTASVYNNTLASFAAIPAYADGWWNVTMPSGPRPPTDHVNASVVGKRGTYPGSTSFAACDLGGLGSTIRTSLLTSSVTVNDADKTVPIGQTVGFTIDLSPLASLGSVAINSANLTIYDPVSPRNVSDGYAPTKVISVPLGGGTVAWDVPADALYGAHPVLVRVKLTVAGAQVEARLPTHVIVGLPSGAAPVEASYRATVQAWFPDWR